MSDRAKRIAGQLCLVLSLTALHPAEAKPAGGQQWVGTWASAPLLDSKAKTADEWKAANPSGVTLREVVHVSLGGETVRVRFSNLYGKDPLIIGAAEIAKTEKGAAIVAGSGKALTFHGQATVAIPAGALAISDPVSFPLAPVSDATVSFFLPKPSGPVTEHQLGVSTSFHAAGNVVSSAALEAPTTLTSWEYLNGVDVLTASAAGAVVTLGDSITDGARSTVDTNQRWPDELARRLQADPKFRHLGVLNEGISGNKIMLDGAGPSALARFDRDILAQTGVKYLLILEGINDIGRLHTVPDGTSAAELIFAMDQMIQRAHAHGIAVIGCTLTPYHGAGYSTEAGEAIRKAVNDFIRAPGNFDGFVDLEAAVRDPEHPDTFLPKFDPGDHLHPNDAGYKAMGDAIDLKLFSVKPKKP
jgi:lysophospholipase L1-like esterase